MRIHVEDEIEDGREEKCGDIAGKTYLGGCGGKWRETCVGVYAATYLVLRALLFTADVVAASMPVSRMQGDPAGSCASGKRLWRAKKYSWKGKSLDAMKN